jgi:cyclic pyranopterin phosphate synthase
MRTTQGHQRGIERRLRLLRAIAVFVAEHGFSPSVTQLADEVGLTHSSAARAMRIMVADGLLSVVPGGRRTVRVTERGRAVLASVSLGSRAADGQGVQMVDVGPKPEGLRTAVASAEVHMRSDTLQAVVEARLPKGEVLTAARIAGIMAAKRTHDLVPLCHPIALTSVEVELEPDEASGCVRIRATASAVSRTGVEMEALVAATVAALTVYDMTKGLERGVKIDNIQLLSKRGGLSGDWQIGQAS